MSHLATLAQIKTSPRPYLERATRVTGTSTLKVWHHGIEGATVNTHHVNQLLADGLLVVIYGGENQERCILAPTGMERRAALAYRSTLIERYSEEEVDTYNLAAPLVMTIITAAGKTSHIATESTRWLEVVAGLRDGNNLAPIAAVLASELLDQWRSPSRRSEQGHDLIATASCEESSWAMIAVTDPAHGPVPA